MPANNPHEVSAENAAKFAAWLKNRGGILVWQSADLRTAGRSVSTPAMTDTDPPAACPSPGWQFPKPTRHITDIADVVVFVPRVIREIRVKLQMAGQHPMLARLELTRGSSNKLRRAVADAGNGAFYRFKASGSSIGNPVHGLMEGEDIAEICVSDNTIPLAEWLAKNPLCTKT